VKIGQVVKIAIGFAIVSMFLLVIVGCFPDIIITPYKTITYDGNGNTSGTVPIDENLYIKSVAVTLAQQGDLERTGYTFEGWNTSVDGNGTIYVAGGMLIMGNSDITLFAKWTPNAYMVTFDAQGGTDPDPAAKSVTYHALYGALPTTTKNNRTFAGWWTGTVGTGNWIDPSTPVSIAADHILYAKWACIADIQISELTYTRPVDADFRNFTSCTVTIMNNGPDDIFEQTVLVEFNLSADTAIGDSDDVKIGEVRHVLTTLSENELIYTYDAQNLADMSKLWTSESVPDGDYYLYAIARVEDGDHVDPLPDNNANMATNALSYTGAVLEAAIGLQSISTVPVDLSTYNNALKYSMVSAIPNTPVEGSGTPAAQTFSITTTSAPVSGSLSIEPRAMAFAEVPDYSVFSAEKKFADTVLRAEEERLLKSRLSQLVDLEQERGLYPSTSLPIAVGTTWDDVYIKLPTLTTIDTTCTYIGEHAYFFVDNRDIAMMEALLSTYAAAFDEMYGVMREKFGTENDVDGNGKIIIVFSSAISSPTLGYFYAGDKYNNTPSNSTSNEGDIFYLSTTASVGVTCGTLAHEFQHMIYFDQHYNDGVTGTFTWLNEALSQAAEYVTGYTDNHLAWIRHFLRGGWHDLSLTYWTSGNYGYGAIFMRYLIDQFGDTIIKDMCSTANVGVHAVEQATGASFNTIFSNFLRALVLDGTGDSPVPAYEFSSLDLLSLQPTGRGGLLPAEEFTVGDDPEGSVHPYGINFAKWRGSFGMMSLSSAVVSGTAFGASR